MNETREFGWTVKGILGMVFTPLGLLYLILGIVLWHAGAGDSPDAPQIFLCVFGGVGLVFLLVGGGLLWLDFRRRQAQRFAYEGGYSVMAKIAGVRVQKNVRMQHAHPYVVECHYRDPDTGVVHVCFSRYLYFDPTDLLTADQVPVYLNRQDGKTVFVDIDAVLPPTQVHP